MKKLIPLFLLLFGILSIISFNSCEKEDPNNDEEEQTVEEKVTLNITVVPLLDDLDTEIIEGINVEVKDTRTSEITNCTLDVAGHASVELAKGTYNIVIEETIQGDTEDEEYVCSARYQNLSLINDNQSITLNMNVLPTNALGTNFIFSEIFFNGETNSGQMMHPDQYYVIFNPTQDTLYADGLCIATTAQPSIVDKYEFYDQYMPEVVPLTGFITIPGSGAEHPVLPFGKLVIAMTAADHSAVEGYDNAVDLSGADFEVYIPSEDYPDVDNPDVPNVLNTEELYIHPRGFWASVLFQLENGNESTITAFYEANKSLFVYEDLTEQMLLLLDAEVIIDGVVTGDNRPLITRPVPESVDRGYFQVSGCHRQELAIRKELVVGDQILYIDTNNSDNDFINQFGQNSYPIGWRDN